MSEQEQVQEQTQEQTIEQRSNDDITVLFKMKPGCIIKMEVHVNAIAAKAAYEKAVKELKKEIALPGFRKGKVPTEVIIKNFSKELKRHYKELLMNIAFKEAVQLIQRRPFTTRSIRKCELKREAQDGSCILLFEYEASPEIPVVDPKAFSFQEIKIREPLEEEITKSLIDLKVLHASKEDVPGKLIQEGDIATISICTIPDTPDQKANPFMQNEELYVQKDLIPDAIFNALIGMKAGETKEANLNQEKSGQSNIRCTIEVQSVQTCTLPEETDEFAIKTGASSIADLKDKLIQKKKDQLYEEKKKIQRQQFKNELIAKYAFDLPQSLIEGETEARYQGYLKSHQDIANKQVLRKEFQEEVKRYFTCLFLMEQIAKKVNPTFNQTEFFHEIAEQIFQTPYHERILHPNLSQEDIEQRILMNIMIKKCCDWCIERSQDSTMVES